MKTLALVIIGCVGLIGIVVGLRYALTRQFMGYHAQAAGRPWSEIDVALQTIMLAMLRVVGGGFFAVGVATLWFDYAFYEGARWAPWAALTTVLAVFAAALTASLSIQRFQPEARSPVRPSLVAMGLTIVGVALALAS